jgi:hypothetical protein
MRKGAVARQRFFHILVLVVTFDVASFFLPIVALYQL